MFNFLIGLAGGARLGGALVYFIRQIAIASRDGRILNYQHLLESEKSTRERIENEFKAAASEALQRTAEQFLITAIKDLRQVNTEAGLGIAGDKKDIEHAVSDMRSRLEDTQKALKKIEEDRLLMYGNLEKSLTQVLEAEQSIRTETSVLKKVLTSSPGVRGSLGEMVLQQILEQNGLIKGIGFQTQVTTTDDLSNDFRPDFVINLPGGKRLVIDSKEVSGEYVLAMESDDESKQKEHTQKLVQNIRNNFNRLSRKEYQAQVDPEVPFVVMFISSEGAIRAAFGADPMLHKEALEKKVFLASPMTLIPLIQLVKYGWQQYRLANNARELGEIVEELGGRLWTFMSYLKTLRDSVQKSADSWDNAIGCWDKRIFPQIQKAKEAGAKLKDTENLTPIEAKLRKLDESRGIVETKKLRV